MLWQKQANKRFIKGCQSHIASWALWPRCTKDCRSVSNWNTHRPDPLAEINIATQWEGRDFGLDGGPMPLLNTVLWKWNCQLVVGHWRKLLHHRKKKSDGPATRHTHQALDDSCPGTFKLREHLSGAHDQWKWSTLQYALPGVGKRRSLRLCADVFTHLTPVVGILPPNPAPGPSCQDRWIVWILKILS